METYTGETVIIKMLEGGIVQIPISGLMFKIENGETLTTHPTATGWVYTNVNIKFFFKNEFVDYIEPLGFKIGEMFVFESKYNGDKWYVIYADKTANKYMCSLAVVVADNYVDEDGGELLEESGIFRKSTEEEREEFKRFMAFYKKGRKMDEFKLGDVGKRENVLYKVVIQTIDNKFEGVIGCVEINEKDALVKYFSVNSVELQFCVEDKVG